MRLLTVHDHPHTLDKTVDDLESLGHGSPSLGVRKSVQSLQDSLRVDNLLSEKFLYKFDCVALSNVTCQGE
jgi:hypothetical protein